MPIRLDDRNARFAADFAALLGAKREVSEEVDRVAADIIAAVREQGDAAVIDYTARFDALTLTPDRLRVSKTEIEAALAACPPELLAALETARARRRAFPVEAAQCERETPLGRSKHDIAHLQDGVLQMS